ncbi:hypothetical protein PHYPSEUDO_008166 [Phytophthora pseudosyringae]|uniref:Uncharacterized protein n=1 Tax=Phytophthora pseudosyringae TaxID=221518 RepID=A0A8T1WCE0_9STRA|nr:hypothetical protein PHYPSEUDO_008166 [Phytophthora pseudosyringae]
MAQTDLVSVRAASCPARTLDRRAMVQSCSLQERSATDLSRIFPGRCQDETDSPCGEDDYFVAEDDGFLDAVGAALDQLVADCKTALRWSHDDADADAAIQAAEQSFCTITSICKDAGLTVGANAVGKCHGITAWSESISDNSMRGSTSSGTNTPANNAACEQDAYSDESTHPPPVPIQRKSLLKTQSEAVPMSPTEEIVEVELTDLLTQSHEEMLSLQRIFEARMAEAEQTREEYEHRHTEEMQSLQEELSSSRLAMDRIKQELLDSTSRKLEGMHSAITASQRAIEAGMKDQARYWKSICEELVVEKREMAQKVAEERGRYTALKAHLASHDDASTRPALHNRVRIRSARGQQSASKMRLCELSPSAAPTPSGSHISNEESAVCVSTCSTPTVPSSRLVIVPNADSVSEPSSAEVSPTQSNSSSSSSKTGKPAFRRYYLAQKRENHAVLH